MGIRIANFLISLTNIILAIISFFLGFRILLRFISANPSTPIVTWIYDISSNLMVPFRGIVPDFQTGAGLLDIVAIIAFLGYALIGYLLIELFGRASLTSEEVSYDTAHYHDIDEDIEEETPRIYHRKRIYSR